MPGRDNRKQAQTTVSGQRCDRRRARPRSSSYRHGSHRHPLERSPPSFGRRASLHDAKLLNLESVPLFPAAANTVATVCAGVTSPALHAVRPTPRYRGSCGWRAFSTAGLRAPASARTPSSRPRDPAGTSLLRGGAPDRSPNLCSYCRLARRRHHEKGSI